MQTQEHIKNMNLAICSAIGDASGARVNSICLLILGSRNGTSALWRAVVATQQKPADDGWYAIIRNRTRIADRAYVSTRPRNYIGIATIWTLQSRSQTETSPHAKATI